MSLCITIYKFTIGSSIFSGQTLWMKVEGVMGDKRIPHKCKGNVLSSCVIPAYMNESECHPLTEKQQEKVQVCEKQPGKNNRGS